MAEYIESLQRLAEQFGRLQGVGRKNAMKMAFSILDMTEEEAGEFASAIIEARKRYTSVLSARTLRTRTSVLSARICKGTEG